MSSCHQVVIVKQPIYKVWAKADDQTKRVFRLTNKGRVKDNLSGEFALIAAKMTWVIPKIRDDPDCTPKFISE